MKTITLDRKKAVIAVIFFTIMFIIFSAHSILAQGSGLSSRYMGFETSFGVSSFKVSSNISEIDNLPVSVAGGKVGIMFGSKLLRTRVGLGGFYYGTSNTTRTVDTYEADLITNVYPLNLMNPLSHKVIEPYFSSGLSYTRAKFFGHYMTKDSKVNYSAEEPFIGAINQVRGSVGIGADINLMDQNDFVHLFSEVRYGFNLSSKTSSADLANTTMSNQFTFNIGVRFGRFM